MLSKSKNIREDDLATPERLNAFSDGVFAVIITIMVFLLKPPSEPTFSELLKLWPTALSYGLSYLFVAIAWVNHHYLLRHARFATIPLIWSNFAQLFSVSLVPFSTAWIAQTRLAPIPVFIYAAIFLLVNITYLILVWNALCTEQSAGITVKGMRIMNVRSFVTISIFIMAMVLAFKFPLWSLGLIWCALLFYLRPAPPQLKFKI
jgi:uncharacterized membrane protein